MVLVVWIVFLCVSSFDCADNGHGKVVTLK